MDEEVIKDNLRAARKRKKISQEELAILLHLSDTTIKDIERKGGTRLFNKNLPEILRILDIEPEALFFGYNNMQKVNQLEDEKADYLQKNKELSQYNLNLENKILSMQELYNEITLLIKTRDK